jgi:tryptophan 7-halogenase
LCTEKNSDDIHSSTQGLKIVALNQEITKVVIVGGGTAGWMAAAALSKFLNNGCREFILIESEDIGTVGVGEATIPPIINFNAMLDIDENEFLRSTQGTFKLGIEFVNWGRNGDRYFHPFGSYGYDLHGIPFHQLYLRERGLGKPGCISNFSMSASAASQSKFGRPSKDAKSAVSQLYYAFHFDASLYAKFLRNKSERQGVKRVEGKISQIHKDTISGNVTSVELDSGSIVEGDIFIDCSGFRGLLIGEALGVGYEDWSHWLPADRAVAVPSANIGEPEPFTRSTAHGAGWQWRIPLQHRTGNGHVYSSKFMSDDEAEQILVSNLEGDPLASPRRIQFKTGRREKSWSHNVIALGLSSGFLEPLESTSIHLIQNGISRLLALFPDKEFSDLERDEYNRGMKDLYEDIRDFIILHYKATQRDDTEFWRYVGNMDIPSSLGRKIDLFKSRGRIFRENTELFGVTSWAAVFLGQNIWPQNYDTMVDALDPDRVRGAMTEMQKGYANATQHLPTQAEFLRMSGAWASTDDRQFNRG